MRTAEEMMERSRTKQLLTNISNDDKKLLSCGEQRICALFLRFELVETSSKTRRFTTDYTITQKGLDLI